MGRRHTPLSEAKKELMLNILFVGLAVLQPLLWFLLYYWMGGPSFSSTYGLDLACSLCCLGSIIALLWFRSWVVDEQNFFDEQK